MTLDAAIAIRRLVDLPDQAAAERSVDDIFYAAAATKDFASPKHHAEFRERWLGRYLDGDRRLTFVAVSTTGAIVGYVAGSHDNPAQSERFADLPYYQTFAAVIARYPAHLHINLAESARNFGIGGRLIEAFVADVQAAGLPGVHVVTGQASRNVRFYLRERFIERASGTYNGNAIVLLGRDV